MPAASELRDIAFAFADIADEAGSIILDIKRRGISAKVKADASPVTEADQAAEAHITERLRRLLPDVPLIAEEQVAVGILPDVGHTFLLVDPLDGTREFVAGRAEYTVNIALVEDGMPIIGVVGAPELDRLYVGIPGWAARREKKDEAFQPIRTRATANPPVAVTSLSHRDPQTEAWLAQWVETQRCCIGSSLKFALLAEGHADIYPRFGLTMEWDTAAGHAVLAGAGGVVLQPDGTPFCYGKADQHFRNGAFIAWGQASAAQPHRAPKADESHPAEGGTTR